MKTAPLWLIALAPLATPQSPATGAPAQEAAPTPSSASQADVPEGQHLGRDGGETPVLPAGLDDSIPLPGEGVYRHEPFGDVEDGRTGQESPFFLGFVGGKHFPPEDEEIDPMLLRQAAMARLSERPQRDTYAFAMFQKRITPERLAELEELGARVLGFHPHYSMKLALPPEAIAPVAAHPAVRWVGVPRPWQKLDPRLPAEVAAAEAEPQGANGGLVSAYVNVFESDKNESSTFEVFAAAEVVDPGEPARKRPARLDAGAAGIWQSNGWQHAELEALGVEIVAYVDEIRAFKVRFVPALLDRLTDLDFVQYVEVVQCHTAAHDESTAMISSDQTRASFTGGTNSVIVGAEVDSGIDNSHFDLNHIWGVGWDLVSTPGGAWTDGCEHGSHVAGTYLGNGDVDDSLTGNAPGLAWGPTGRLYNVKIINDTCGPSCATPPPIATIVGLLNTPYNDGTNTTPIPHVISNSWGCSNASAGTDADSRTVDGAVWDDNQLWVFAAGNEGPGGSTLRSPGAAKNAFTVGSVTDYWSGSDPSLIWTSSSRGPTADNRWKPNVSAPGRWIRSVDANSSNQYVDFSGTSMATPHVSGVAAQMMDSYSFLRYAPQRVASLMMATAITKNNATICCPSASSTNHLNQYGAGRVEAYRTIFGTSDFSWSNWGFTLGNSWTFADFNLPVGTTRVAVVMHYIEDEASAGASQALVNDYDLWLDQDPIDPAGNTGEWFAQQSPINNTEIRIIDSPASGAWRWKVWPDSVTSSARIGVTVAWITADTTPDGTQTLTATDTTIQPGQSTNITSTVFNPDYVASAVYLDSTLPGGTNLTASTTTLKDGAVTDMMQNQQGGDDVLLGNIINGQTRSATWTASWATEGVKTWTVQARSDNWVDETDNINIIVDGTAPTLPTNLASSTHTPNVWSNNINITYTWTAATDGLSGVDGYGIFTSSGAPGAPSNIKDIEESPSNYSEVLFTSSFGRYFNMKTVDNSGNWTGGFVSTGPYLIDTVAPSAGTIRIDGGAARTTDLVVDLDDLGATEAHSGLLRMQLSNNGSTWTGLLPYSSSFSGWDLTSFGGNAAPGTKRVYVRYRDTAGNTSSAFSDTIQYGFHHAGPKSTP